MKFVTNRKLFLGLIFIYLLSLGLSRKSSTSHKFLTYTYEEDVGNWSLDMANGYRDMAGLGYVTKTSITSQLKIVNRLKNNEEATDEMKKGLSQLINRIFTVLKWEHIHTFTGDSNTYFYSYTILRSQDKKKLVCAFSGTKGPWQLKSEMWNSGAQTYFRDTSSKIKIMKYFHELYQSIQAEFITKFEGAKVSNIKQYIFVGHSLGGAIASIALFDLSKQGKLNTDETNKSPVLITFGQPRTGNYVFSNELRKIAPIIYRHVNDNDLVPGIPDCVRSQGKCINEFSKNSIDTQERDYQISNTSVSFFAWHLPGLVFINGDGKEVDSDGKIKDFHPECIDESENARTDCLHNTSLSFSFHKYYFGYKISDLWKPEVYNMFNSYTCGFESAPVENVNPPFSVWKEKVDSDASYTSYLTSPICNGALWIARKVRQVGKKKKLK
jgi:hypothetical protein